MAHSTEQHGQTPDVTALELPCPSERSLKVDMSPDRSHPSHLIKVLINSTSGAMGGVACVFSGQPFDTVKVKMQTFPSLYRGFVDCAVRTYHTEGLRGLYHGTVPALLANVSENAVLFACYGFCQNLVCHLLGMQDLSQLRDHHKATAGSLASVVSSLVLCPTELVKCRMQTLHEMRLSGHKGVPPKSTPYSIVSDIVKTEGVCGLFRGLSSTWLREIPGYFFFFGGYELSSSILSRSSQDQPGALVVTVSGGVGGAFFWLSVYPVDSVKSRIQVLSLASPTGGFLISFLHILKTEGLLTLYSGLMPTIIRSFPSNAALFLAYEMTKRTLTEWSSNRN
ncbi:mitochondrial ornithine transporter 1-like isoform X3 [Dendrobates tinctorius]|uniref:mitochondrial ornithine transporter 1-like isoform X3 n=1 Tax=Dendrobates tinctorius TaxID=92724 RepID=UPI003CC9FD11